MASDSNTDVNINEETFNLVAIPNARSKMVQSAKDSISDTLDLERLVNELRKLILSYRVAYNGVAGITELQIKVQRVGYKITELAENLAEMILKFKNTSTNVLQQLQRTYQFLLDKQDDMALKALSLLADVAVDMAKDAEEAHKASEAAMPDVRDALNETQKEGNNQEARKKQYQKDLKEYETELKIAKAMEQRAVAAKAEAQQKYNKAQVRQWPISDGFRDFALKTLKDVFIAGAVGGTLWACLGIQFIPVAGFTCLALLTKKNWDSVSEKRKVQQKSNKAQVRQWPISDRFAGWICDGFLDFVLRTLKDVFIAGTVGRILSACGLGIQFIPVAAFTCLALLPKKNWDSVSEKLAVMKKVQQELMRYSKDVQRQRDILREAEQQCVELIERIKSCEDVGTPVEAAIEALHHSIDALRALSKIMLKGAKFFRKTLVEKEVQQFVKEAMKNPDKKGKEIWTSTEFKTKAVLYCSQWVALEDVCASYASKIKDTREDMYAALKENQLPNKPGTMYENLLSRAKETSASVLEFNIVV